MLGHAIVAALSPGEQDHLLAARQMQALSFAVHIPLVAFGTALSMCSRGDSRSQP